MKKISISVNEGVGMDWDKLDEWQQRAHQYTVTLKYQGRQMTLPFFMGQAHTQEPTLSDVLPCLISDYQSIQYEDTFEGWAESLGFDSDSRKAERIYKQTKRQSEKLKNLFRDDLDQVIEQYQDR